MDTVSTTLLSNINHLRRNSVFTTKSFLQFGTRDNIDKILSRLCATGKIQRLISGIYFKPKIHKAVGLVPPSINDILKALSIKNNEKIYPSGATCANMLHLTTQVPAKYSFLTTGKTRIDNIIGYKLGFKHFTKIKFPDDISNVVMLILIALNYIGKDNIDDDIITKCKFHIRTKEDKDSLRSMMPSVPSWIATCIKKMLD